MYGFAKGVAPSRDVAGSMQNAMDDGPPLSGINGPGNSLTMEGPATEPMVNDMENKKLKMAMLLAGKGMQGFGQGMSQNNIMTGMNGLAQAPALDSYGQPLRFGW